MESLLKTFDNYIICWFKGKNFNPQNKLIKQIYQWSAVGLHKAQYRKNNGCNVVRWGSVWCSRLCGCVWMTNQKGLVLKMPFPSRRLSKTYHNATSTKDTLMSYFDVAAESSSGKCHTHSSRVKAKAVSPDFILNHKRKILKKNPTTHTHTKKKKKTASSFLVSL